MKHVGSHLCNNTAEADLWLQLTSERASEYILLMMSPHERANCAMSMGPIAIINLHSEFANSLIRCEFVLFNSCALGS